MEGQRSRARSARQESGSMQVQDELLGQITVNSDFVGYDTLVVENTKIEVIIANKEITKKANEQDQVQIMLSNTPFYAVSGGQIADIGQIRGEGFVAEVQDVTKAPNGQHLHTVVIKEGVITEGATAIAEVDPASRKAIIKNHTATHLLHQALKDVLGEHVNQAGSLVSAERLRFDFSHFGQVTKEELAQIEEKINEQIWQAIDVDISLKKLDEAKAMGAMALFGEKYGETVRVVKVGDYSLELCGGCHVRNTAEIGLCKLVSESGIGAGVRRIEAVTAQGAYEYMGSQLNVLQEAASLVKAKRVEDVVQRLESLNQQLKELQRENESLSAKLGNMEAGTLIDDAVEINGVKVLAKKVNAADMDGLRAIVDKLKKDLSSGIIVLGAVSGEKVNIVAGVTKDLIDSGYHAGKLVKEVATRCGGGGGGRPDMAQAGGKQPADLESALAFVHEYVNTIS